MIKSKHIMLTDVSGAARRRGRMLFVKLLEELGKDPDRKQYYIPARITAKGPKATIAEWQAERSAQRLLVLEYLDSISDDREALEGFCSMLQDLLIEDTNSARPALARVGWEKINVDA